MNFYVMTLFPEMIEAVSAGSILGRAEKKGVISVKAVNFRDFTEDRHHTVDDYPYGGGAGMLIKPEPIYKCYQSIAETIGKSVRVVYLTPKGERFTDAKARELAGEEDLILLAGHYEGIDERVIDRIVTDRISIGDYVLTGGELASLVVIDAVSRKVAGVLSEGSLDDESFSNGLLEYPQYTRPEVFMGESVPEILLSGHHENVEKWRREQSIAETLKYRPDLLATADLTPKERKYLAALQAEKEEDDAARQTERSCE